MSRLDRAPAPRSRVPKDPRAAAAHLLSRIGISTLPVPVERMAEQLGATLTYAPVEGDISGFVVRRDGSPPLIGVNSAHPPTRQRFTLAHELGHLILHDGHPLIVDKLVRVNLRHASGVPRDDIEVAANRFAAALLMPAEHVRREFARLVPKQQPAVIEDVIVRLADRFRVSSQAMAIRLNELDLVSEMTLY